MELKTLSHVGLEHGTYSNPSCEKWKKFSQEERLILKLLQNFLSSDLWAAT